MGAAAVTGGCGADVADPPEFGTVPVRIGGVVFVPHGRLGRGCRWRSACGRVEVAHLGRHQGWCWRLAGLSAEWLGGFASEIEACRDAAAALACGC